MDNGLIKLGTFALFSFLLELTPGPNMGYLVVIALNFGRRVAMFLVLGIATGLFSLGLLTVLGLGQIVIDSPLIHQALRYAGLGFMLYLAYDLYKSGHATHALDISQKQTFITFFTRGFLTNILNPKSFGFFLLVVPEFMPKKANYASLHMFYLIILYCLIATIIHTILVMGAHHLRAQFLEKGAQARFRTISAALTVCIAVWLFLSQS